MYVRTRYKSFVLYNAHEEGFSDDNYFSRRRVGRRAYLYIFLSHTHTYSRGIILSRS